MIMTRKWLDWSLFLLFVLSLGLVVLGNGDPVARNALCKETGLCFKSVHAEAWNLFFYNSGIGGLISILFYGLLVRLPEIERRKRIKRSLEIRYRQFKKECILVFLGTIERSYQPKQVEALLDQKEFKDYFKQEVSDTQDRWHVLLNKLESHHLEKLAMEMEIFREEILFVLHNTDITAEESFEFFKDLSSAMYSIQKSTTEYDSIKSLSQFLWALFAGWDHSTGYRSQDVVHQMIRSI